MWVFSAARCGVDPALHRLPRERGEVRPRILARTPRYGKLSPAGRCTRGVPWYRTPSVESSCLLRKSKAVATLFSSLTRIPDQRQKSATTFRRWFIPSSDSVHSTKSSANPRAGVRRPEIVLCATPVARSASRRQLKMMPKSRGDNLSPCLVPLVSGIEADCPYGRSAT